MSDLQQFMQQPFVASALAMLCFFTILLAAVVIALIYVRRRKAGQRRAADPNLGSLANDSEDLPDLDVLTSNLPPPETPTAPSSTPAAASARVMRKGTFTVTINDGGTAEAVEVMTVLRDVVEGKLVVQMGDKIYQNINTDAEFKDRFTRLMRDLAQVAKPLPSSQPENPAEQQAPASEPPDIATETVVGSAPSTTPADEPSPEVQPPRARVYSPPPPVAPDGEMPGDLPKFSLDDMGPIKPTRAQRREAKPVPEINIAAAIEAYLQHKLRFTPAFDGRSIHIYPSPDGGVSIEVDERFFESVGDVTDPQVRDFLQTTIQEWQDRA